MMMITHNPQIWMRGKVGKLNLKYNFIFEMSESAHNAIVLKPGNEERFNKIYTSFAKTEPNAMRFSEFMQFLLDRCMITNKITLRHFYNLFVEATQKRIDKEPPPPNNVVVQKNIKKEELIFLFNELGKFLYHGSKGYQDKIYNDLLGQKITAEKQSMHYSRVMQMDEINRKMFMENSVKVLTDFEEELKNLYLIYVDQNYWCLKNQGRILLNHREVQLQNKRMSAVSFVRFLKEAEILPHLINIEHVEEILNKVVPPTTSKESEFYYKHFLVDSYSKDLDNPNLKHESDPGLALFEFIIALARIGVQTSKEVENTKKVYDYIIPKLWKNTLNLRTNHQLQQHKEFKIGAGKPYLVKLRDYYRIASDDYDHKDLSSEEEEEKTPFQIMREKQKQMSEQKPMDLNINNMVRALQSELPPMPPEIEVKQQQQPPFPAKFKDVEKITMGQQPPPEKMDKNKQMKQPPKKKPQLKKGEKPPRVFQYMDEKDQTKKVESSEDYFQKLATQLDYSLKPLSSFDRGSIPLDPFPSLISQILYPNEMPESVIPFIEAGLNAHNESRFALAIENYKKAHQLWKSQANLNELKPNLQLFFEFTIGGVYMSAGKDDYAFNSFFNCRFYAQKLNYLSPDRALPYCGLGQVLYNAEEYQLATRCYLKARQIREKLLGMESVDTATVFNNLGCCFFMEDRNKEALSYFKIASTVFISQLGQFHERSQTARENVNLCNKSFYKNTPEYRKLWEVFEKDPFGKKKKKKKKDGKGKGK